MMSISALSLLLISFSLVAATTTLDFPRAPCPFVAGCHCVNDDVTQVDCGGIGPSTIYQLSIHFPHLEKLSVNGWDGRGKRVDLDIFNNLTQLQELSLTGGKITRVMPSYSLPNLQKLNLSNNWLEDFEQLCSLTDDLTSLKDLDLSSNYLTVLHPCIEDLTLKRLDLHNNQLSLFNGSFAESMTYLDISKNRMSSVEGLPAKLTYLNISANPVTFVVFPTFPQLKVLDMSRTAFQLAPSINAPQLKELWMNDTTMSAANVMQWNVPKLETLSLANSRQLVFLAGHLRQPKTLRHFVLTNSRITALPQRFFDGMSPSGVDVSGNPFDCDNCTLQWAMPIKNLLESQMACPIPTSVSKNCSLGISATQAETIWGKHGSDEILPCTVYGDPSPTVEWWLFRPSTFLGRFDPKTQIIDRGNATESTLSRFSILGGGALLLHSTNKTTIERYICVVRNGEEHKWKVVRYRLDYSDWYSLDIFESVFYGAIAFCILLSALSFLLNITWILTRKSVLWWIQRAERLSRVRKMVEAMEKYRTKQMESLHDKYTKKVQNVRDNYHQQVEQLRGSYASQAGRFRDYRAAQMESVTSHLESIRENYQQQVNKVRDYGSRRAEALWESYERQANRVRTFSLQHRLKLMRQYQVKQRYLNKLLENFQDPASPEALRKHEEEVRAALELPDTQVVEPSDTQPMSRTPSFYSLPEYVIGDDGELRPGPHVPQVRFTHEVRGAQGSRSSREMGGPSSSRAMAPSTSSMGDASAPSTSARDTIVTSSEAVDRHGAGHSDRDWY